MLCRSCQVKIETVSPPTVEKLIAYEQKVPVYVLTRYFIALLYVICYATLNNEISLSAVCGIATLSSLSKP